MITLVDDAEYDLSGRTDVQPQDLGGHDRPASGETIGFIDLFAGCGGLALGFKQTGRFAPVDAVEWDADAAETYSRNVDDRIRVADIAAVQQLPKCRLVVGGPPCQGFSQLGSRDPDDPRNQLWREYLRVLDECEADVFVMENVPQLLRSPQFREFLDKVTSPERGFNVLPRILSAQDYGVPQNRRRAIVIGSRLGFPPDPRPTHGPKADGNPALATVRDAFNDPFPLPFRPDGVNRHEGRPGIRESSLRRYRAVPHNGGDRFQMQRNLDQDGLSELVPPCWRNKVSGTTDVFGRLWWDRPSPTIRTEFFKPEKGRYLHPEADRPITLREAARLQTFPDDFEFPQHQSMVSVARQIGNAVPPRLAKAIADSIYGHLLGLESSPLHAEQLKLVS